MRGASVAEDLLDTLDRVELDVEQKADPHQKLYVFGAVPALALGASKRADLADPGLPEPENVDG